MLSRLQTYIQQLSTDVRKMTDNVVVLLGAGPELHGDAKVSHCDDPGGGPGRRPPPAALPAGNGPPPPRGRPLCRTL